MTFFFFKKSKKFRIANGIKLRNIGAFFIPKELYRRFKKNFVIEKVNLEPMLQHLKNLIARNKVIKQSQQEIIHLIHCFEDLIIELILKKYSNSTVKTYHFYNGKLLRFSGKNQLSIPINNIDYLLYPVQEKNRPHRPSIRS